jgi:hypothetical protein
MTLLAIRCCAAIVTLAAAIVSPSVALAVKFGEIVPPEKFKAVGKVRGRSVRSLDDGKIDYQGWTGTGTLVAPDLVLMAAHVVRDASTPAHISFSLDGNSRTAQAVAFRVHQGFGSGQFQVDGDIFKRIRDDIALIKLDAPLIEKADLPDLDEGSILRPGLPASVVGYGMDETQKNNVRRMGALRFLRSHADVSLFAPGNDKNQMMDHGDSGGPILAEEKGRQVIVAVVQGFAFQDQWKLSDETLDVTDVRFFVTVRRHLEWLQTNAAALDLFRPASEPARYVARRKRESSEVPLNFAQVATLLQTGLAPEQVLARLLDYGVSEPFDSTAERQLRQAGAGDELIRRLAAASLRPYSLDQLKTLIQVKTPENSVLRAFLERGVERSLQTEDYVELRRLGASAELISALKANSR